MMFLILDETPVGSVNYLLEHTNERYLKKQVLELLQLICSAGYSNVYKKIPQGKAIQNWIKASHTNEMFVWYYLHCAFYLLYNDCYDLIPDNYKNIVNDFTEKIKQNNGGYFELADSNGIESAIFRYQKQYNSEIPTNTELPIKQVVKEYRKYLQ